MFKFLFKIGKNNSANSPLGFNCKYIKCNKEEIINLDPYLIELALKEDRILLTMDKELFRKALSKSILAIYTLGDTVLQKLQSIFKEIKLPFSYYDILTFYRCTECNHILIKVGSKFLNLPANIKSKHPVILYCIFCNKRYWKGTHWKKIKEILSHLVYDS